MACGTLVLGGIVFAPVVAVASWRSRAKAKKFIAETERVRGQLVILERETVARGRKFAEAISTFNAIYPRAQEFSRESSRC